MTETMKTAKQLRDEALATTDRHIVLDKYEAIMELRHSSMENLRDFDLLQVMGAVDNWLAELNFRANGAEY